MFNKPSSVFGAGTPHSWNHPIKSPKSSHKIQQLVTEGWIAKMVIRCRSLPRIRKAKKFWGFINPTKNCDFIWCCMALYGFIWFYMVFWVFTMFIILLYLPFHLCSGSIMGYDMILRDFTNKVRGYQQKQTGWPPPVISWFITPSIVSYTIVTIVIIKLANELGPNPERNMRFHWNMWWNGNSMRPVETISRWVWRK